MFIRREAFHYQLSRPHDTFIYVDAYKMYLRLSTPTEQNATVLFYYFICYSVRIMLHFNYISQFTGSMRTTSISKILPKIVYIYFHGHCLLLSFFYKQRNNVLLFCARFLPRCM